MTMKQRATVVCWKQGRILLVERGRARWSLPGGTIRRDETPAQAALRELGEETTLTAPKLSYLFQFVGLNKRHHVFFAVLPANARPKPANEIVRCRWFRPHKLDTLLTSVPTREIVRLVLGASSASAHDEPSFGPQSDDEPDADGPRLTQSRRAQTANRRDSRPASAGPSSWRTAAEHRQYDSRGFLMD